MVLFFGAAAVLAACAHDDGQASTTRLTSAAPTVDPTYDINPEQRLAGEICRREAECNVTQKRSGWSDMVTCVRGTLPRVQAELAGWKCDPAATRARYKDCLATVHAEPCSTIQDVEMRVNVCRENAACTD